METTSVEQAALTRARARELRAEAASRRLRAVAATRRSNELVETLVDRLTGSGRHALGDHGERYQLQLGRLLTMVRLARFDLRRWLERRGLPSRVIGEIALACSEACANAVEHPRSASRPAIKIEATCGGQQLELRVRDFGAWTEACRTDERGRGLALISALMDSVDVCRNPHGTEIVMRRSLAEGSR